MCWHVEGEAYGRAENGLRSRWDPVSMSSDRVCSGFMTWRLGRTSRETRLLTATLLVAVFVLFVLARFRYPSAGELSDDPRPAPPFVRLGATATYAELAAIIAQLQSGVGDALLVLRIGPLDPAFDPLDIMAGPSTPRFVPALRIRNDVAIARVPEGAQIQGIVSRMGAAPTVIATDSVRRVSLVRVPAEQPAAVPVLEPGMSLATPTYVAVAEGSRGGATLRPLFLARTDPIIDPRWDESLLALGGALSAQVGSFVFTLDGRLAGILDSGEGTLAMVPAATLLAAADRMASGRRLTAGDLGLALQSLTPGLAIATGANHGAVVSFVDPSGPSAGILQVGDVIRAISGEVVYSVESLQLRIARLGPRTPVTLAITRADVEQNVTVTARARNVDAPQAGGAPLGLNLREVEGVGAEVLRVMPRGAGAAAGLLPGDLITHWGGAAAPARRQIVASYEAAGSGTSIVVGLERQGRHLVLALEKR